MTNIPTDSTTRFGNRVEDYVKYRPGYPTEIIQFLQHTYGLSTDKLIADIGAGTGISSALFLNAGYRIIAVEPNPPMRNKSIELLGSSPNFTVRDGTAEHTGLDDESVDAIIAGQAFHWFDQEKAKIEFRRISKPDAITVLIWNERKTTSSFEKEYDEFIIKHAHDYVQVDHRNISPEQIVSFFAPLPVRSELFANEQVFDFAGLKGRLLSSSYIPAAEDEGFAAMISDLRSLFDRHQRDAMITISYDTKVYVGRMRSPRSSQSPL
jgi:SAM-dependent methyltransferase